MTILEKFKELVKTKSVIEALESLGNAYSSTKINDELEKEILEFGDYFVDNYEDDTYDERIAHFGEDDAFILILYDAIVDKIEEENNFYNDCEENLIKLNRDTARSLENAFSHIERIDDLKIISIQFCDGITFSCEYPENPSHQEKLGLKSIMAKALTIGGVMLIELKNKKMVTSLYFDDNEIFNCKLNSIKKMHNINPFNGKKEPKKGYTYFILDEY